MRIRASSSASYEIWPSIWRIRMPRQKRTACRKRHDRGDVWDERDQRATPQLGILDHTSCPDDMLVVTAAERRTCRKLAWRPTPMGGGNSMTSCGKSSVAILASALVSN